MDFELEPQFVAGLAIALGLSVVFIAGYVFSVAEEARRMSAALSASYMALDREQRLSSLGALAAAAAHRLGSPLGTIAVVAKELARDLPADNPMRGDVELLLSETERCRLILTELSTRPEGSTPLDRLPIAALVEMAAGPYRTSRVKLTVVAAPMSPGADKLGPPTVPPSPALLHGLGNLLQNAMEFARKEVRVLVGWDDRQVMVTIKDDGAGFAPGVLDHLGEPYMSGGVQGRTTSGEPMGLGVFISQTLLEQTDARLHFANGANGGGEVTVTWDRARLQGDAV
jgi:two-component system sensor histidine kinase RegB